ncbi:MAG: hypothetical protein Q9215_001947 [Flavoplaca cf. flavocitrina]
MNIKDRDQYGLIGSVENELRTALEDQDSNSSRIDTLLQQYRASYEDLLLKNYEDALSTNIEDKLWDAHVQINGRFRRQLGYFRNLKGKRKPVEQRKVATLYLRFLKASQRFYRGYIQKLAARSCGISELTAIARKFSLDVALAAPKENTQTTPEFQHAILRSCHRTLIHLGDLSRYRESEIDSRNGKKNWQPAIDYYDLAIAIKPSSGTPHNQLAIIARIRGNSMRTLYHLYRAQSAYEPPPRANENLDLELKKLRESLHPADFAFSDSDATVSPSKYIQRCFPLLHACYFGANDMQAYHGFEDSICRNICKALEGRSLATEFVDMAVLSNIATDFLAGDRWQAEPENLLNELAFKLMQRLNIRTFSSLLQTVGREYQNLAKERNTGNPINSAVRRLLPSLRYYSAWLISRAALLSVHLGDVTMDHVVKNFWVTYADTMTLLMSDTEINNLPRLQYLLEEDVSIIGFRPLQEVQLQRKPNISAAFMRRVNHEDVDLAPVPSDIEVRCRIQDLLEDILELAKSDTIPVKYIGEENCFTVEGDWIDASQPRNPSMRLSHRSQRFDMESTTDSTSSHNASGPLLQTQMVVTKDNDSVPDTSSSNMAPPSSTNFTSGLASAQSKVGDETSYAVGDSTLAVLNIIRVDPQQAPKQGSTQSEHNAISQSHVSIKSTPSEVSDMPDPTQAPFEVILPRLHSARIKSSLDHWRHQDGFGDDIDFDSPNVFPDSSDRIRRPNGPGPTPPNGQG